MLKPLLLITMTSCKIIQFLYNNYNKKKPLTKKLKRNELDTVLVITASHVINFSSVLERS